VLHQVGAGTLGQVFRAHDPAEGRLVAVKAFRLDLIPETVAEFAAALDALAGRGLDHPSIAAPIGAGVQGTTPWLAQAYVPAESLDSALRQYGPPPLGDALAIVTALAGALDYAAAAGVLHGALHPRDVLVAPDDTRLVDLGVAAALESVGLRAPVRRPYTAPERIEGAPISRAADIFSLGAIAFELVAGQRVTGAGDQAVSALPEIPGANRESLADTFAFVLSSSPDERFTTALGFAAALKRALGTASMHSVPAPPAAGLRADTPAPIAGPVADAPLGPAPDPVPAPSQAVEPAVAPDAIVAPAPEPPPVPKPKPRAPRVKPAAARADAPDDGRGRDEPVLAAPPIRHDAPHVAPLLDDVEFRAAPPADAPDEDWPAPPAAPPPVPRVRPAVAQTSFSVVSMPLVIGIFVVGALVGLGLGWMVFGRHAAPSVASSPQPVAAPARLEPVAPAPEAAAKRAEDAAPAQVAGPSAPSGRSAARNEPAASAPKPSAPAAPTRGQLTVRSTPTGARVELNGRARGQTPVTLRDLPLGALTVRVTREGFGAEQRRVTLTAARAAQTIDVPLARVAPAKAAAARPAGEFVGSVFVETRPAGARVFIDGRDVGTSPVDVPGVRAGSHVVRLELAGHKRWTASVSVVAGERNRVAASLEEQEGR
jgi:hypothetical protein